MEKQQILLKRIKGSHGLAEKIPEYATTGSAAVDLCASVLAPIILAPGQRAKVPTGLAIQLPHPGIVALVFARSGLADKHGINLTNGVGVIDSDYRGEIQVLLSNHGQDQFVIEAGARIAQMAFMPVFQVEFKEVEELDDTARGKGGFGSTGI